MSFRVLVVDDASFVRDTIKRNLRPLIPNVEIFEAPDGRKAMSLVKTKNIQLILSDWEMPEVSGEEFVKWLRQESDHKTIPFIMVTSRGDRDHVMAAVTAGVSDYMTKPFTPDELHRKVAKQLKRLGYKMPNKAGASAGAFSSADVLTGGAKKAQIQKPREIRSTNVFAKPQAPPPAAKSKSGFKGKAYLRFANNVVCDCQIKDLSLQALSGSIARPEHIPSVFEQASVDLENDKGEALARVNAYVHAVFAGDPRPDAQSLKITVRFVDNDPEKFEVLSKAIAGS